MSERFFFRTSATARHLSLSIRWSVRLLITITPLLIVATARGAGPLSVDPANPRYFFDSHGSAIYLAGTYLDHEKIELGTQDFISYLDFLQQQKHNFTRLWAWEQTPVTARAPLSTLPYERKGQRLALDGGPKFDLSRFDQTYFDQLRDRVSQAAERGIYVSVVLFQGVKAQSTAQDIKNSWSANPLNRDNNVNRIDGDTNHDGMGDEAFNLTIPAITSLQEAYVRKVVDTLNDLDNVLYEVSGDASLGTSAWQSYIVKYLKSYEATKPNQHPVGISYLSGTRMDAVSNSPADWLASYGADLNPPLATGGKVLLLEASSTLANSSTGHQSIWQSFMRGYSAIDKEPDSLTSGISESLHGAIAQSIAYSKIVDIAAMQPSDAVCSSTYCLVKSGAEYLIYLPSGGSITVDLTGGQQNFSTDWFNSSGGQTIGGGLVRGGGTVTLASPFKGETLLHLLVQPQRSSLVANSTTIAPASTTVTASGSGTLSSTTTLAPTSTTTTNSKKNTVNAPAITPDGGAFAGSMSVSVTDATPGATIYYTVDGSSPTQSSTKYSAPIVVSTDTLLKAKAFKSNSNSSPEASAWFAKTSVFDFGISNSGNVSIVAGSTATNTISSTLVSGSTQAVAFSVSGLPSGATGSFSSTSCNPTCSTLLNIATSGSIPTGSFSVNVSATGGGVTRTSTFTLAIAAPSIVSSVATPTITPNGGNFIGSVAISMTTTTSGASIYYTTDGSAPTTSSKLYAGSFNLTRSATIRAKAFKSGYTASGEASASFASDLVAYWKFDEGTGTTTADASGNGNTGTLVNTPRWSTGIAGNALYFDGVSNNVLVADSPSLDFPGPYTLSAWVNPTNLFADFRSILVKNYTYYLYSSVAGYCGDGTPLGGFTGSTNNIVCQPVSLPANIWTHISLTFDGSTLTLYRNGISVATSTASEAFSPTPGTLQIGASQFGEFFNGLIDEVRVYNRALSAAEILTLYQQNAPIVQPFDFALSSSGSVSAAAGVSGSNTISATLTSGSAQAVSFSVSGLPSGATASFSSGTCAPTCSSLLTISTSTTTPTGNYSISVSGTGGGVTRTTAFTLSVTASIVLTAATPTINPNGGTFSGSLSVAMQTPTAGASIYYTTDGSTPTQSSSLYTGAMTLTSSATVNARAFMSGYNPSAMASAAFTSAGNANTYYVAKTGSDNNSCSQAKNPNTPKLTITAALACVGSAGTEAGAGYAVQVASGIYNETVVDKIPSGSSWGAPFTLKSASPLGAILRPPTNGSIIGMNNTGHYIIVDGFTIDGQSQTSGTGIALSAFNWGDIHHIRIINNEIKNIKNDGITGGHGTYLEIINNSIHDVGSAAPGYAHGIYAVMANSTIDKNKIFNSAGYGLHFYNNFGGTGLDNNLVRYNILHDNGIASGQAAILASGTNMQIYGNIAYNNPIGISATQGGSNIYVYNNTIYGNSTYGILNTTVSSMVVKNNISYSNVTDLSVYGTSTVQSNNLLGVNPLFVDPTNANFQLQSGSPAIGGGTCLITSVLPSICSGTNCDVGAYQNNGSLILSSN